MADRVIILEFGIAAIFEDQSDLFVLINNCLTLTMVTIYIERITCNKQEIQSSIVINKDRIEKHKEMEEVPKKY